jgi:hypothetical protein
LPARLITAAAVARFAELYSLRASDGHRHFQKGIDKVDQVTLAAETANRLRACAARLQSLTEDDLTTELVAEVGNACRPALEAGLVDGEQLVKWVLTSANSELEPDENGVDQATELDRAAYLAELMAYDWAKVYLPVVDDETIDLSGWLLILCNGLAGQLERKYRPVVDDPIIAKRLEVLRRVKITASAVVLDGEPFLVNSDALTMFTQMVSKYPEPIVASEHVNRADVWQSKLPRKLEAIVVKQKNGFTLRLERSP